MSSLAVIPILDGRHFAPYQPPHAVLCFHQPDPRDLDDYLPPPGDGIDAHGFTFASLSAALGSALRAFLFCPSNPP